jgi:thiol-disulfide isomerase/thioredoxin
VTAEVVLYTRRHCGLCDDVADDLRALQRELRFSVTTVDIDTDDDLRARYSDVVPVVAVAGEVIARAPVDPAALRDALARALQATR